MNTNERIEAERYLSGLGNAAQVFAATVNAGKTTVERDSSWRKVWIAPIEKTLDRLFGVDSERDDRPFLAKYGNLIALAGVALAAVAIWQAWRARK